MLPARRVRWDASSEALPCGLARNAQRHGDLIPAPAVTAGNRYLLDHLCLAAPRGVGCLSYGTQIRDVLNFGSVRVKAVRPLLEAAAGRLDLFIGVLHA